MYYPLLNVVILIGFIVLSGCDKENPQASSPGIKLVQNATGSGIPTIVEFGSTSCTSCQEMKIILDHVTRLTQGRAHVINIDITKDWDAAQAYGIQLMPTQVFFGPDGREIGRHMGKLAEAEVIDRLGLMDAP